MDRAVERVDPHHADQLPVDRRVQATLKLSSPGAPASRLSGMLNSVFRDRRRILLAMGVVLLATGLVELLEPKTVTADAELLVLPQAGPPDAVVRTEIDILRSRPLAETVVAAIGPQRLYPGSDARDAVRRFAAGFGAEAETAGNVIVVRFSHADPAIAAQAVNQAIVADAAMRTRLYDNDRQHVLPAQVAGLRRRLDAAEQAFSSFTVAHGSRYDTALDILLRRKDSLEHDLDQAGIEFDQARARLASDASGQDRLRAEQDIEAAGIRRSAVATRNAQVADAITNLEAQEPEFLRLRRQRDLAAASYQAGAQALDQGRLAGDSGPGAATIRVLQAAEVPQRSARQHLLILGAGIALSLLAGVVAAILCAIFRRGYADPGRIERDLGLPVLTSIGEWPARAPGRALETQAGPQP